MARSRPEGTRVAGATQTLHGYSRAFSKTSWDHGGNLTPKTKAPLGLRLIAAAKLAKGVALSCLSLGIFDLIHKDLAAVALHFVQIARISPENRYVEIMLATLVRLGIAWALYASILLVEGLGLWFGAAWAEYVVVVSSGIFVPEECLAILRHFTWLRLAILILNGIIFAYVAVLVWERYRVRRSARAAKGR